MRASLLVLTMLTGMVLAAPARAQLASGYSGQSSAPRQGVPDDYWYLLRQIGPCVAKSKSEAAHGFLAAAPDTREEARAFRRLFGRKSNICMRSFVSASFVRAHLRGAVAEGLYEQMAGDRGPSRLAAAEPGDPDAFRTLHDFAGCYVTRNPADAHHLLAETSLGSQEEADAVVRMAPGFKTCFPADRKIAIDATEVRMALAEALYHAVQTSAEPTP